MVVDPDLKRYFCGGQRSKAVLCLEDNGAAVDGGSG